MPTENRSSNTVQMVSLPLDLVELALAHLPSDSAAGLELRELLTQPATQHQGEPVMKLEAEKVWGGAGEYAVSFVKAGWLQECRAKGGTFLLYTHADTGEVERLQAEVKRLKGLQPDSPPRPPDGQGLPRYGLRWNGPQQPLAVPMDDGYWTPWHLAVSSESSTSACDGFSAEQMTVQGADGYRNGIKAAAELAAGYPELAQAIRDLPLPQ